jgi:hypothetical protein
MSNSLKILGLILICLWSCKNPKQKTDSSSETKQTETFDSKVAILLNTEHNKWLLEYYGFEQWEPSEKELNLVQEILQKAIQAKEFDFLKEPIKKSIESYYRQYVPYVNKNGERFIEINAFCEILESPPSPESGINEWTKMDWHKEYVRVDDGGPCYWRITINIDTMEFKDLMVNGVA